MKTIPLTKGQVALIDDADYEAVSKFKWYAVGGKKGTFYAARTIRIGKKKVTLMLHSFLMAGAKEIDHEDGNGLNNRMYNLRPCTHAQNVSAFKRKKRGATSIFRGVSWYAKLKKWIAGIRVNGKRLHLGYFLKEKDAARAYDVAARKYFGDFASPNLTL